VKKNDKFSHSSFKTMIDVDGMELDDTYIQGSCFYQDSAPYSDVFPKLPEGGRCELLDCNVDNCKLPEGYVCTGRTTNKHFLEQKTLENWIVDERLKPIEPVEVAKHVTLGISIKPSDLPTEKRSEPITVTFDPDVKRQRAIDIVMSDKAKIDALVDEVLDDMATSFDKTPVGKVVK